MSIGASKNIPTNRKQVQSKRDKGAQRNGLLDEEYRWPKNDEGKVIVPYGFESPEAWGRFQFQLTSIFS